MAKKIKCYLKLQVSAGMANPSPPIGPALGQQGINIMEFCKMFNKETINLEKGMPIPVIITIYNDKSFTFITKTPPTSFLLKKIIGVKNGSATPNTKKVGKINYNQLKEIACLKQKDMTGKNIENIIKCVQGTAISMGLTIED